MRERWMNTKASLFPPAKDLERPLGLAPEKLSDNAEQLFQVRVICVAEDRKSCEPALKLLLTSLNRYSADVPIVVFYPPAEQDFLDWVHNLNFEKLEVRTTPVPGAYGWNAKPQALLELLKEGSQEVIWIDSDIL